MSAHLPHRRRDGSELEPSSFESDFDRLVEAHYGRLCTFAYRILRERDAAEDAVQDVLLKVWARQARGSLRDTVPYLYHAVRNQCLMALRRDRRWNETTIDDEAPAISRDDEALDLEDALARAIAELPERTRLVFSMHREQDLTYSDIARALGISVKTVETQMTRALKILRHRLAKFFEA